MQNGKKGKKDTSLVNIDISQELINIGLGFNRTVGSDFLPTVFPIRSTHLGPGSHPKIFSSFASTSWSYFKLTPRYIMQRGVKIKL